MKDRNYTIDELQKMIEDTKKWISSEEGQKELDEAYKSAKLFSETVKESCEVDWKVLHEPMTI